MVQSTTTTTCQTLATPPLCVHVVKREVRRPLAKMLTSSGERETEKQVGVTNVSEARDRSVHVQEP